MSVYLLTSVEAEGGAASLARPTLRPEDAIVSGESVSNILKLKGILIPLIFPGLLQIDGQL